MRQLKSFAAIAIALFVVGSWVSPALAEEPAKAPAKPKCEVAEVNPVTGHVMCIKPIGAPVEPPPEDAPRNCDSDRPKDQDWSFGPKCGSAPPADG